MSKATVLCGDNVEKLRELPADSVDCVATSPDYFGLRSYLKPDDPLKAVELGQEKVHDCLGWATGQPCGECWVCHHIAVFAEVRRVLKPTGVCFVNLGDS